MNAMMYKSYVVAVECAQDEGLLEADGEAVELETSFNAHRLHKIRSRKRARLAELAHELKGVYGYFGLRSLTRVAAELEDAASSERLDGLLSRIRFIKNQVPAA